MIRIVEENGCEAHVDFSTQVIKVDIFKLNEGLGIPEPPRPLFSHLSKIDTGSFVSTAVLAAKAKAFDDGLYASVEMLAQNGTANFAGKKHLLTSIIATLNSSHDESAGANLIRAAATLSGLNQNKSPEVQSILSSFLSNEYASKPMGFYTWTETLKAIFQQDRLLQSELDSSQWNGVLDAMNSDAVLRKTYVDYLNLISALSNPFSTKSLSARLLDRNIPQAKECFFPPSISFEYLLMQKLFDEGTPFDINVMDEIIKRLNDGSLDLTPGVNSGWYDYQIWSIAPLAISHKMPETQRLSLSPDYQARLLMLFKGLYALTRETHVKQMGGAYGAAPRHPRLIIRPSLTLEPTLTYFYRRAVSYKFVRELLEASLGRESLSQQYRVRDIGPPPETLLEELEAMERLFYGAHLHSCSELALEHSILDTYDSDAGRQACRDTFTRFSKNMNRDADLATDMRMMVPVAIDDRSGLIKVWMFLGWESAKLELTYSRKPEVVSFDSSKFRCPTSKEAFYKAYPNMFYDYEFGFDRVEAPYPVFAEANVSRIFDRKQFRNLCDGYKTAREISEHLSRM